MVTGAASGVGRACTRLLEKNGYQVLACVRREADVRAVEREHSKSVQPLIVELRDQETIDRAALAAARITAGVGLRGLEPQGIHRYGHPMEAFTRWTDVVHKRNLRPEQVARAVVQALRARRPRTRYRIGLDSHGAALLGWLLPDRLFDMLLLWLASLPIRFGAWADDSRD